MERAGWVWVGWGGKNTFISPHKSSTLKGITTEEAPLIPSWEEVKGSSELFFILHFF